MRTARLGGVAACLLLAGCPSAPVAAAPAPALPARAAPAPAAPAPAAEGSVVLKGAPKKGETPPPSGPSAEQSAREERARRVLARAAAVSSRTNGAHATSGDDPPMRVVLRLLRQEKFDEVEAVLKEIRKAGRLHGTHQQQLVLVPHELSGLVSLQQPLDRWCARSPSTI